MRKRPHRRALCAAILAVAGFQIASAQSDLAAGGSGYALVSPAAASALAARRDWPEAIQILAAASRDLDGTPHPLARIHMEGTLPHQGIYDQSKAAVADFGIMRDLGLAYRLTGDARYLNAADAYLDAWATIYRVSLNPIDETNFENVIVAWDLVSAAAPDATRQNMTAFLRAMAQGYAGAVIQKKKDAGNWQSHRIKMLTLSAFAVGDPVLIAKAHAAFLDHLRSNIRPDGSVYDYYYRDALHYVVYDLEPLSVACLAAENHGQDWYHEDAPASVAKAVDWLVPFATGRETHIEFVHSKVGFDQARAHAGLGEYGPHPWSPAASIELLTTVAALDPARTALCRQVAASANKKPTNWRILLFWPTAS